MNIRQAKNYIEYEPLFFLNDYVNKLFQDNLNYQWKKSMEDHSLYINSWNEFKVYEAINCLHEKFIIIVIGHVKDRFLYIKTLNNNNKLDNFIYNFKVVSYFDNKDNKMLAQIFNSNQDYNTTWENVVELRKVQNFDFSSLWKANYLC